MRKPISKIPGPLIVWMVSYAFFLFTLVANFSAAHDSINYLNNIVRGEHLFHQHHLLYHATARCWLMGMQLFFPSVPDYYLIEAFTAVWGSSSLAVIYAFFRNRFILPVASSAAGVAIIAFSYGMWFYSVNIEVYAPPVFLLLTTLYVLTKRDFCQETFWQVAALHSLAILFHQVNILFAGVVLYELYKHRKFLNFSRVIVQYAVTGVVIVSGAYFIAGWLIEGHDSLATWIGWMEGYTVGHGYWQPLSWKTPFHAATGFSHAFIGGHYLFQLPFVERYFQDSFQSHGLNDEIFLSANISSGTAWILTVMSFVLAFFLFYLVFRFLVKSAAIFITHGRIVRPLLLSILLYSLFFCFWMPEILEFWIFQMTLVWILLIGLSPFLRFPFRIPVLPGLILTGALLFFINYFGSIRWLQDLKHDWYYDKAARVSIKAEPADLVILNEGWILKDFLLYFSKADIVAAGDPDFDRHASDSLVVRTLDQKATVFIYALPDTLQPSPGKQYIDSLLVRYQPLKHVFNAKDPLIFEIR